MAGSGEEAARRPAPLNYWAVLVSALVYYGIESAWFSVFGKAWLAALGKSIPEILGELNGRPLWPLYVGAFVSNLLIAFVLAWIFARAGVRTATDGMKWAAILWLGLVATVMVTNYSFEVRRAMLIAIDAGCPLVGMLAVGAILGAWRKKVAPGSM
jgi:small basic protein